MISQRLYTFRATVEPWQKTLYIVFFAQLVSVIGFATIYPFLPLYVQTLDRHSSLSVEFLSGLVFSAQAATMMIAAPIWGSVADRHGRKLMIERAMFGGAVTVLLMGLVSSAEMLVALRALQGIITGTVSAANALVASQVPRQRVGYAMGLLQVGLWGGTAVGPLLGGALADAFGYRMSFTLTAVLLLIAGVLVWWGVEEKFTPPVYSDKSPKASVWASWQKILLAPGVTTAYGLRFLSGLGNVLIVPIAPLFILSLLPGNAAVNTYTGLVIGVSGAASTVTAVYFGRLGDKIGHRRILKVSAFAAGLFYLPQAFVAAAWQLLLLQALTGAAMGGIITSLTALLAQYTQPGAEGSVYGLDSSIVSGSRVIAPLAGAAIAHWFNLRIAFGVNGVLFLLIALIALWQIPEKQL